MAVVAELTEVMAGVVAVAVVVMTLMMPANSSQRSRRPMVVTVVMVPVMKEVKRVQVAVGKTEPVKVALLLDRRALRAEEVVETIA